MKQVAGAASNTPFYLYDIDIVTGIFRKFAHGSAHFLAHFPTF